MNLLITGGSGFIGSNFIRFLVQERPYWSLTNLDALTYSGNPDNLADVAEEVGSPRYTFVHGDICNPPLVEPLVAAADAVVHFAAESHVDRSILDSKPFIVTNVLGTQTLLDAARKAEGYAGGDKRFLHVSTDEVYGDLPLDRPDLKFKETTPYHPSSPYSASKAASDLLVRAYHHTFGLNTLITNCSNNFGPYQFPEKVIPLFVTNLLQGKKVPLYGDGRNVRDWLHVIDHCEAILTVLENGKVGDTYNIGGDNERSNLELTHMILDVMGLGHDMIQPVEDRLGHDRRYAIDPTKIRSQLGWRPTRSAWPAALESTVAWYREHETWWRRVQSGAYQRHDAAAD